MSTVKAGFDESAVIESIEETRTYPKRVLISYLTGKPLANCYRNTESKKLIPCDELDDLIAFFGLLPLGPDNNLRFRGRNIIESEERRATDTRSESLRQRASRDELRKLRAK